jgi:hypothetical protein
MNPHDLELAQRLYARTPVTVAMKSSLPELGESLSTAAMELAREISLDKVDAFLARLKGAEIALMHLRNALDERG